MSDPLHDASVRSAAQKLLPLLCAKARHDPAMFMRMVLKDEKTGRSIKMAPLHHQWQSLLTQHTRVVFWSHVEGGKLLPLDTQIPTPRGWTSMGKLVAGDEVFAGNGSVCRVTAAHAVKPAPKLHRVRFDDGTEIIACAEHQWKARTLDDVRANRGWRVVTTSSMIAAGLHRVTGAKRANGQRYHSWKWRMPLPGAVEYPGREFLVAPYVLGYWLGDGTTGSASITCGEVDLQHVLGVLAPLAGGHCAPRSDRRNPGVFTVSLGPPTTTRSLDGLRANLRSVGVLDRKHIPDQYTAGSIAQRFDLLAGLMDSDGTVDKRGHAAFSSCNEQLARGVLALVRSLGVKAAWTEGDAKIGGRIVGRRFRVRFMPHVSIPVFKLPRKAARQTRRLAHGKRAYRFVESIAPVRTAPGRCITVDSGDGTYLAGRDFVVTHNTSQIAVGRTLWELGRDPTLRVAIISNTKDMAMKIVRLLAQYIERSDDLHAVFPNLLPTDNPSLPWKSMALTVRRPGVGGKDPSVQACGVHGNILGSRVDLLLMDDVLDHENTATPAPREDVYRWLRSTPFSRLTENARIWITGNAWHPSDAMHRLAKEPRFKAFRFPVIADDGSLTWPARWPMKRILDMKADLGPLESARQLMCQARDDTSARFKREWIDSCLELGEGLRVVSTLEEAWKQHGADFPEGCSPEDGEDFLARGHASLAADGAAFVFCGVDLAVQRKDSNDLTSFFVLMVEPDGKRRVLFIDSGRWTGPEILNRIENLYRAFGCMFIVENNAAQHYIVQWAQDSNLVIPVIPFTTGRNKAHPEFGVESIGAEMAAGKWLIPNMGGRVEDEIGEWIQELLFYDPREHVGDRVMAGWFAREGARRFADYARGPSQEVRVRVIGGSKRVRV